MKRDLLKQYALVRQQLADEKEAITARLAEIDAVLTGKVGPVKTRGKAKGKRGRQTNELSLKEAILKVIEGKSLTKQEVFAGITKLGYTFSAKDPMNSINTVLYGKKPKFKNAEGKFSLA